MASLFEILCESPQFQFVSDGFDLCHEGRGIRGHFPISKKLLEKW